MGTDDNEFDHSDSVPDDLKQLEGKNPWHYTPEEETLSRWLRSRSAEEVQQEKNLNAMSLILAKMLAPLVPEHHYSSILYRPDSHPYHPGRGRALPASEKLSSKDVPLLRSKESSSALFDLAPRVVSHHKLAPILRHFARATGDESLGLANRLVMKEIMSDAESLHRVGATLYLLNQMHTRQAPVTEPSLNKAHYLYAYAPLTEADIDCPRIAPKKITDLWKNYYQVADWWAAFVVATRSPLAYSPELLRGFLRSDPVEVSELAGQFHQFRKDAKTVRSSEKSTPPHLKKGLDEESERDFPRPRQNSPHPIPDLLAPFQWATLDSYTSKPNTVDTIRRKKQRKSG